MSLENLLKIGQIKPHVPDKQQIAKLLAAADRSLQDAERGENSAETRFDLAYKAIMQSALVALQARGYRPDTNRPGHHATVIQSLPLTIGLAADRMAVLDKLRKKRNLSDYFGADVDDTAMAACVKHARQLLEVVRALLLREYADLL